MLSCSKHSCRDRSRHETTPNECHTYIWIFVIHFDDMPSRIRRHALELVKITNVPDQSSRFLGTLPNKLILSFDFMSINRATHEDVNPIRRLKSMLVSPNEHRFFRKHDVLTLPSNSGVGPPWSLQTQQSYFLARSLRQHFVKCLTSISRDYENRRNGQYQSKRSCHPRLRPSIL